MASMGEDGGKCCCNATLTMFGALVKSWSCAVATIQAQTHNEARGDYLGTQMCAVGLGINMSLSCL